MHGDPVGDGGRGVPSVSWEESRVSEVGSLKAASTGEGQRGIPAGVRAGVGAPRPVERQPSAASPPTPGHHCSKSFALPRASHMLGTHVVCH